MKTMSAEKREALGQRVREAWVVWAKGQPDPKPSWLTPYSQLEERDKEADRQIGEAIWRAAAEECVAEAVTASAEIIALCAEIRDMDGFASGIRKMKKTLVEMVMATVTKNP